MKAEAMDLFIIIVSFFLHTSPDVPAKKEIISFTNIKTCEYILQVIDDRIKLAVKANLPIQEEGRFEIEKPCEYYPDPAEVRGDNGEARGDKRRDLVF